MRAVDGRSGEREPPGQRPWGRSVAGEGRTPRGARAQVGSLEDGAMSGRREGGADGACISRALMTQEARLFPRERVRSQ